VRVVGETLAVPASPQVPEALVRPSDDRTARRPTGGWLPSEYALTVHTMTSPLLTEGDLDRDRPPQLTSPHGRCGVVPTGAVCTRWPHGDGEQHQGYQAVQGTGRSTCRVPWTGGTERAMVVDGDTGSRLPGTNVEVRALTDQPLALQYRPSGGRLYCR
jgi:hypothetical protein